MNNLTLSGGSESVVEYNFSTTTASGLVQFTNGTGTTATFTFANQTITDTGFAEFYAHCDASAGQSGTDNYITFELRCVDPSDDTLQTVDIDTRSIQKGSTAHLTFGPAAYRVVEDTTGKPNTIKKTSEYRLYVDVGRDQTLSEIKLIIKLRN